MEFPYNGRYINLDRSTARREQIERQLGELGIAQAYSRFAGIDGRQPATATGRMTSGEYGCFASHTRVLKEACAASAHLHVVEDDVLLSPELVPVLTSLIRQGVLDQIDLIFTDIFVQPELSLIARLEQVRRQNVGEDPATHREHLKHVTLIDLRNTGFACTSSYLVSQRALGRLAGLLESRLLTGPDQPIDLLLRDLVDAGTLRAACVMPFLTSVDLAVGINSDVRADSAEPDLARLACNVVRQTLFVRPDWSAIDTILARYFPVGASGPRRRAVDRMLDFLVFGKYELF
jgi:GR25 family glycosyltransferase involved in LPS biosynthesis